MQRVIAVDCDNTVVHMDWEGWKQCQMPNDYDPLDYWRSPTLYDKLEPMEGSVECLEKLSKHFNILFVSRLKGWHHRSKVYFLKKHFPFMEGFIGTHEKWIIQDSYVALIDDDIKNFEKVRHDKRILFGSDNKSVAYSFKSWDSVCVEKICEMYL